MTAEHNETVRRISLVLQTDAMLYVYINGSPLKET